MPVVTSVYSRPGPHVVAQPDDYVASEIRNDSAVEGESLADASASLQAAIAQRVEVGADLAGTAAVPRVAGLRGRPVADIAPNDGDRLVWSAANQRWEPRSPTLPTVPRSYAPLYEADFAAQENQIVSAPGAFTIDGKTWWAKASAFVGSDQLEVAAGSGFSIRGSAVTAFSYQPISQLCAYFSFSELDGYDPTLPVAVQLRWANINTAYPGNSGVVAWLLEAAQNGAQVSAAESLTGISHLIPTALAGNVNQGLVSRSNGQLSYYSGGGASWTSGGWPAQVHTLVWPGFGDCRALGVALSASDWPNVGADHVHVYDARQASNPPSNRIWGLGITLKNHGALQTHTLRALRVLQPGATP